MVGSESSQPQLPSQVPGRSNCGPIPQVFFSSHRTKEGPAVLRTPPLYVLTHLGYRASATMSLCGPKLLGEMSLGKRGSQGKTVDPWKEHVLQPVCGPGHGKDFAPGS